MKIKFFICFLLMTINGWSQQNFPLPIIEQEITDWEFRMVGDSVWKPAKVPGTIIDNFVDLGDISNPLHPYYGDNEKLYQWIGERDWEFRTTVFIDKDLLNQGYTYDIEFESLDLYADIYINEDHWTHNNAFYPLHIYSWRNEKLDIRIVFHSTVNTTKKMMESDSLKLPGGERIYARTAQYQFGWDWGPKFVNMGIRKPAKLVFRPNQTVFIHPLRVEQLKSNKKNNTASVWFDIASNLDSIAWQLKVYLNGDSIDGYQTPSIPAKVDGSYQYQLRDPLLWWPNGSKENANYYEFDLTCTLPGDTHVIARQHFYYAFCNIQLQQKKDKYGESFYFTVNGEKVFAKGANYVPDDSFEPGKNTTELIKMAADANMNMLRVWGGGSYPDDDFYIECMKNGIMVWQDFMFACAMYPWDNECKANVEDEAYYQTKRLYPFNNIAVWCGNNENEEGWKNWGWQKELEISAKDSLKIWNNYIDIFENTLKHAAYQDDTNTRYISTSPKHGWGRKESMTEGDSHYWGVWWGLEPIEKYNEKVPRFMSEFGMQAMPDMSTLKKVIPDSAMNFTSPKFKNHQKHPTGFKTLDHYLKEYLIVPENMEDYVYATQVLQAYALTTAIDAQRRAMPYCMGSLIWQLNDCWPVTSWSLIDHDLNTKISYTSVTSSFEPVIISIKEEENSFDIYVVNDMLQSIKGQKLIFSIQDFHGKTIISKKLNINVTKHSSKKCYSIKKKDLNNIDLTTVCLKMNIGEDARMPYTYSYFVKLNQLKLPIPEFKIENIGDNHFKLSSNVFAPYVYIDGTNVNGAVLDRDQGIIFKIHADKIDIINAAIADPSNIRCLNTLIAH